MLNPEYVVTFLVRRTFVLSEIIFLDIEISPSFLSSSFSLCLSSHLEDVTNLTASDVMNRVNLGYLQGKHLPLYCFSEYGVVYSFLGILFTFIESYIEDKRTFFVKKMQSKLSA